MSVANGREFLMIPGPTTIPDRVLAAMHRPSVDIYAGPLVDITDRCLDDLRLIFRTEHRPYIYISNGHGAWEAALSNTLSKGDKVLVLESGRFAINWGIMGEFIGLDVEILPGDWHQAVDPQAVEARLKQDSKGEIKAVLVAQIDTATSVCNDILAIRAAITSAGHPALFMVDTVASLATTPFEMDAWDIDVAISGSQKGLMTPPGLSFVAAGPRAKAAAKTANLKTQYWDWGFRDGEMHYEKYCGTPPVHMLYGLREALDMILEEGLENVLQRHARLAEAARAAIQVWSGGGAIEFGIRDPSARSNAVTVALMDNPERLIDLCRDEYGVTIGGCIGDWQGTGFRLGHMGHVNAPMLLGALGVIESVLVALDIPIGASGCGAAARALAASSQRSDYRSD